jgi:hypothetical protein
MYASIVELQIEFVGMAARKGCWRYRLSQDGIAADQALSSASPRRVVI